jgi:hypothetical protein
MNLELGELLGWKVVYFHRAYSKEYGSENCFKQYGPYDTPPDFPKGDTCVAYWKEPDGKCMREVVTKDPDYNDAHLVINEMRRVGYDFESHTLFHDRWHARFNWLQDFEPCISHNVGNVSDAGTGDWFWGASEKSFIEAVYIAAKKALTTNERAKDWGMVNFLKEKHSKGE